MHNDTGPAPCPECGHAVYRPLMAPVRHEQLSCRALVVDVPADVHRCGCSHEVHRIPTLRPRHRQDEVCVAS